MAGIAEKGLEPTLARPYKTTKKKSDAKQRKLQYRVMEVILYAMYKIKLVSVFYF